MAKSPAIRAEEILRQAEDRLAQLEAAGLDVRSLHKKLEKAKQLDADEKYEEVIKTTEEILVVAKIARDEVQTSLTSIISKGKTQRKQLIDEKKVKEIVAQALQEEIDKFIHSKSLRSMLETIAREEAEEQVGKVAKTVEDIDSRTEKLTETVGAKADGAAVEALQSSLDEQVSELATPEEINSTVASLKEELTGKISALPLLSKEDVGGIVEKALADAGYAVAADIAAELASTEDEVGDKIAALSKELKDASKAMDKKLSSMPQITEKDVDSKVEAKAEALKGEVDERLSALATTEKLNSKIEALEHETNNKFLNLPRLSEDDVKRIAAEAAEAAPRMTEENVKRIAGELVEAAPKPETLAPEQVENMVTEKAGALDERISALDERISDLPITAPDEVNHIVVEALRSTDFAAQGDIDAKVASLKEELENKLSSAPKLTEDDVKRMIPSTLSEDDVKRIAAGAAPQFNEDDLRRIVGDVVSSIEIPSTEQIESLIAQKIAGIETPASLSRADVENIITEVLARKLSPLESKLSTVESGIEERINAIPTMSKDEVDHTVVDALRSSDFASANDIDSKIASLKQEIEARPAPEAAGPSLTEDDVKRIAAGAAPQFSEDDLRRIVGDVVSSIEIPSTEQIEGLIAQKIAGIETPASLSRADVENIITEVLARKLSPLESKLSTVESGIEERINAVPTMSKDEVDHTVVDALRSSDFVSANDIDSKIASLKQEIEARPAPEAAGPSLTEDDVRQIVRDALAAQEPQAPAVSPDEISRIASEKVAGILRALREKLA
jgi:hypothetical protein